MTSVHFCALPTERKRNGTRDRGAQHAGLQRRKFGSSKYNGLLLQGWKSVTICPPNYQFSEVRDVSFKVGNHRLFKKAISLFSE